MLLEALTDPIRLKWVLKKLPEVELLISNHFINRLRLIIDNKGIRIEVEIHKRENSVLKVKMRMLKE